MKEEEILRLQAMWEIEHCLFDKGYNVIAGVDEAGRGPLAGPVCAAAVILPEGEIIEGLNDSKKLSEKKRNEFYKIIYRDAIAIGIGIKSEVVIDEVNIYEDEFIYGRTGATQVKNLYFDSKIDSKTGKKWPGEG